MGDTLLDIWVYLAHTPLLWLTVTLGVYYGADQIYKKLNMLPILHPLVLAIAVIVPLLVFTDTSYETYFDGAQFIHFLLGPATVALAVPLYLYAAQVKRLLLPIGLALLVGSATGILSAVGIGRAFGASDVVLVILTGIVGAIAGPTVLNLLRIREASARGFALGLASHGLGTARAFQMSEEAGAFSGLGMGFNGALTAVLVPVLIGWLL